MKSWKFSGNSDRNWVSDQGKTSETYSAWYNGGQSRKVGDYKKREKAHFNMLNGCKVTSNEEDYRVYLNKKNNWIEHDNCKITRNYGDYHHQHKKPKNYLDKGECRITQHNSEAHYQGDRTISHLNSEKCKITKNKEKNRFTYNRPINHITNNQCKITTMNKIKLN